MGIAHDLVQIKIDLLPYRRWYLHEASAIFFTRWSIKRCWKKGNPVLGYFHPYDIDTRQEHFMHPGVFNNNIFFCIFHF